MKWQESRSETGAKYSHEEPFSNGGIVQSIQWLILWNKNKGFEVRYSARSRTISLLLSAKGHCPLYDDYRESLSRIKLFTTQYHHTLSRFAQGQLQVTELSPCSRLHLEKSKRFGDRPGIQHILWNLKVYYRLQKKLSCVHMVRNKNHKSPDYRVFSSVL